MCTQTYTQAYAAGVHIHMKDKVKRNRIRTLALVVPATLTGKPARFTGGVDGLAAADAFERKEPIYHLYMCMLCSVMPFSFEDHGRTMVQLCGHTAFPCE